MEDLVLYNELYDLYGELLTDKQKEYFKEYFFNNLSFSEIAEEYNVSRNAVFKQIHIVTDKLKEYEEKLKLYDKKNKLVKIIDNLNDENIKKDLEELI